MRWLQDPLDSQLLIAAQAGGHGFHRRWRHRRLHVQQADEGLDLLSIGGHFHVPAMQGIEPEDVGPRKAQSAVRFRGAIDGKVVGQFRQGIESRSLTVDPSQVRSDEALTVAPGAQQIGQGYLQVNTSPVGSIHRHRQRSHQPWHWLDIHQEGAYAWASDGFRPVRIMLRHNELHRIRLQPRQTPHRIDQVWLSRFQYAVRTRQSPWVA